VRASVAAAVPSTMRSSVTLNFLFFTEPPLR
jgi:hypothetical protein